MPPAKPWTLRPRQTLPYAELLRVRRAAINERTHSSMNTRQIAAIAAWSATATGYSSVFPCAFTNSTIARDPAPRNPSRPTVTATCIHSIRCFASSVRASAPATTSARPVQVGISAVSWNLLFQS